MRYRAGVLSTFDYVALWAACSRQCWFALPRDVSPFGLLMQPTAQPPSCLVPIPAPTGMCSGFRFPVSGFFLSSPRRCPTRVARVAGEMITNILRLIPNFPLATICALPATASSPLILRLKNLMLKTCPILPQNRFQPVFVKQEEFVFCEQKQRHL